MKFTILTQYYPPEIGAPQARLSALAAQMTKRGHQVTILTAMPNYPTGKVFAGYVGMFRREKQDGVKLLRAWIYPTQKADYVHRLTNYMSFNLSSALIGSFALERCDYLMVESPPLFLGMSAFWLSRLKRARLIFNVSDLWPESAVRLGVLRENSLSYRLSARLERFCYEKAWLISGQSRSILDSIQARYPSLPTFHLSNGVDASRFGAQFFDNMLRKTLAPNDECVVMYAGLHGLAQGLDQVVRVAAMLKHETNLRFVLIGDGPEKQALVAQAAGVSNIRFEEPRPASEIPPMLAAADIILVTLKMHIPGAVPSKLYEAMASGKPVILVAEGEAAAIVHEFQAGMVVKPGDLSRLAQAAQTLAADPELRLRLGANGRRAAEQHFDRSAIVSRFIDHLQENILR